ncbi:MAG: cytochrome c [Phaeodactylibacter sp.]|nr:cytochrome c [Phaeodactylibacter sp.]
MRTIVFLLALAFSGLLLQGCGEAPASAGQATMQDAAPPPSLELPTLREDDELLAAIDITIPFGPGGQEAREYRAIALEKVLRSHYGGLLDGPTADSMVLSFICKDGYSPFLPLKQAMDAHGYLAFKAHNAPMGKDWPDSLAEAYPPFYLVWDVPRDSVSDYPWPYGLERIQLVRQATAYSAAYPGSDKRALEGFEVFRAKCLKCHSINKVGGSIGPEFNYPKNLTEYWDKADVKAFVRDPQSFRYNSEMKEHPSLSDEQFDAIWAYLLYMKAHKL